MNFTRLYKTTAHLSDIADNKRHTCFIDDKNYIKGQLPPPPSKGPAGWPSALSQGATALPGKRPAKVPTGAY